MLQWIIRGLQKLNWSVWYKIGLAFLLVLICFIGNGIISVLLLFNIKNTLDDQKIEDVYLERLQRYDLAYKSELNIYSDAIFITSNTFVRDNFRGIIGNDLMQRDRLNPSIINRDFEARFNDVYVTSFTHLLELENFIVLGQFSQARPKWLEYKPDFDKVTVTLNDWRKQLDKNRATTDENVRKTIVLSTTIIVSLTVLSIGLALILLFLIDRVLVQPLNRLKRGLEQVAEGELNQQLEIYNRDEVGKLAFSFKQAVSSLQQVISGVQISESLQAVTRQLASVSKQQAAGSNEQVAALAQVMAAMQELGRTAGQISDSAVQVASLTNTTLVQIERVAAAGNSSEAQAHLMVTVVESTLSGVERVGRQVAAFRQHMLELNEQSAVISKVVSLLGAIADEVHLLALNAAIEAAGAGEYGERFKVVAHEIKQLANRANRATQEAQTLVNGVQASSRTALSQVEEGQAEVSSVVEANSGLRHSLQALEQSAQQVSEAVAYLLTLAGQVTERAEEIRQATFHQRTSSEQVLLSARAVGAVAEQTAVATHQIADSSSQLETLTNQLSGVLSQVKLTA